MILGAARDAWLIYIAAWLRSMCVGVGGVVLAIFLAAVGLPLGATGLVLGVGLAGAAVMTVAVGAYADRIGRRRTLVALTLLTAFGYAAVATSATLVVLLPSAFVGMLNGMGRDRGPAAALEQAILPETTGAHDRTWTLAWYNVVLDVGHAVGALAGMTPMLLVRWFDLEATVAHRLTFLICASAVLSTTVLYAFLSPRVEVKTQSPTHFSASVVDRATRRTVGRLALLFGLDSLGGGFLSSALIAYWFFQRYGLSEGQIAVLFFAARAFNALSHVGAAWLASRIGLLNTMVFTHLPSSVFLMAAPAAPTAFTAGALFLAREAVVEMDVPTRQSYVMAIVPPSRRTFASAVTNVTRTVAWAFGPAVAGFVMQHVVLAGPLFIGGSLKIVYDLLLYRSFKHVKPPEEVTNPQV